MKKKIYVLLIISVIAMIIGLNDFYRIIILLDEKNLNFDMIYGDLWFIYTWGQLFISGALVLGCLLALVETIGESKE